MPPRNMRADSLFRNGNTLALSRKGRGHSTCVNLHAERFFPMLPGFLPELAHCLLPQSLFGMRLS